MKHPAEAKPDTDLGRRAVRMSAGVLAATAALGNRSEWPEDIFARAER